MFQASSASQSIGGLSEPSPHPLLRRLDPTNSLSARDHDIVLSLVAATRLFPSQTEIAREGEMPAHMHVLIEGFACRYKIAEGGRRQIVSFLVPGDLCDAHLFLLDAMDHSILTLSEARIAQVPRDTIRTLLKHHPAIAQALFWMSMVDGSISREWLANMGRRSPDRRIGHLLCEMLLRLRAVGLAEEDRFAFPITQADLGDTMGLSTVHVNRTLQELKEKKLIHSRRGTFQVIDVKRLIQYSDFDPSYLYLHGQAPDRA